MLPIPSICPAQLILPHGIVCAQLHRSDPAVVQADLNHWVARQCVPACLQTAALHRQAAFWAGRYCAMRALSALGYATDHSLERLPDRRVAWPAGYVGSISHSGDHAIALVGRQRDWHSVAVDVQSWMSAEQAARVAPKVLLPSERAWLAEQPPEQQAQWISRIFSIKETIYKLLYADTLRYMPFFAVQTLDIQQNSAQACLTTAWGTLWPAGQLIAVQWHDHSDAVLTWAAIKAVDQQSTC